MIKVYYRINCPSSRRTLEWFEKNKIPFEKLKINKLKREDIINILISSDQGMSEIIKNPTNKMSPSVYKNLKILTNMNFNDSLIFLLSHHDLLRSPIILDEKQYMIGFNDDEIRRFIPKEYRRCYFTK